MESASTYEYFLRRAFAFNEEKHCFEMIVNSDDNAHLSRAQLVTNNKITSVKVGTAYAMSIFNNVLINHSADPCLNESSEKDRLDSYLDRVLQSKKMKDIISLIMDYKNDVWGKYLIEWDFMLKIKNPKP